MQNCRYKSCVYGKPNFGVIEVDWKSDPVTLKFEIRDVNGSPVTSYKILLSDLQVGRMEPASNSHTATHEVDLPWIVRFRLAIVVFCASFVLLLGFSGLFFSTVILSRKCIRKCKHD